jgi:hypothetical protein
MSKRDLKKYVSELTKEQLEEQVLELYDKFSPVKVYYNFVFKPNEQNLLKDAKLKIAHEYFPLQNGRKKKKPKMRRSVAQKFIKHFILLGVDPFVIADTMLYSIEIAQTFEAEYSIKQELFYKSMFTSFNQAIKFVKANGILSEFKERIISISTNTASQKWFNKSEFENSIERLEY